MELARRFKTRNDMVGFTFPKDAILRVRKFAWRRKDKEVFEMVQVGDSG